MNLKKTCILNGLRGQRNKAKIEASCDVGVMLPAARMGCDMCKASKCKASKAREAHYRSSSSRRKIIAKKENLGSARHRACGSELLFRVFAKVRF